MEGSITSAHELSEIIGKSVAPILWKDERARRIHSEETRQQARMSFHYPTCGLQRMPTIEMKDEAER